MPLQADVGVDPGEYARMLMREARKAVEDEVGECGAETPVKVLEAAYTRSQHIVGARRFCQPFSLFLVLTDTKI